MYSDTAPAEDIPFEDEPHADPYEQGPTEYSPGSPRNFASRETRTSVSEAEERIVLGAMMESTEVLGDILDIITVEDFYNPRHATIFSAIITLYGNSEPAGAVAVAAHLFDTGDIKRVGGMSYIHDCIAAVPTAANGPYYARKVAELAMRRRITVAGEKVGQIGNDHSLDIDKARSAAEEAVWSATLTAEEKKGLQPISSFMAEALEEIWAAGEHGGGLRGITTGYQDLDQLTGGYRPGQLIVIAGRPGMGKTVSAVDAARANAIAGNKPVAIFSLEMEKKELLNRILAAEAKLPLFSISTGDVKGSDKDHLKATAERISSAPLHIDDTPGMTITDIRSRAVRMHRQSRGALSLIIVDYLQLMLSNRKTDNRQQEIADITRGLKLLSKELKVPVIAVAQLNRNVEQRGDKRPMLSDLRESGAIEQDSDIVILLHREDYYDKEHVRAGEADLIVAKHRGGATDTITLAALLHQSRFASMAVYP